jgi:hypothetical protein
MQAPVGCLTFVVVWVATSSAQTLTPKPALPVEPIAAILHAFRTYPIVALDDPHGNEQAHAFVLTLIRDPRLPSTINDIVVESGNAQFQDVMDGFVRGEDVPYESLRQVWTHAPKLFEQPMYEEFFRAVRAVNAALSEERRLRVVLGEAPDPRSNRSLYAADVIRREVLAAGRRALVIYGGTHFLRKDPIAIDGSQGKWQSIVRDLESKGDANVFSIWFAGCADLKKHQRSVASWPTPSLAIFAGTALGMADYAAYVGFGGFRFKNGKPVIVNGHPLIDPPRPGLRMEEQFDAVLYLGPPSTMRFTEGPRRCP